MSLVFGAVLILWAVLLTVEANAQTNEERLAKLFSPILILTEETGGKWGNIKVTKPEPVGIMGATSADSIWFEMRALGTGPPDADDRLGSLVKSGVIHPRDVRRNQNRWFPAPDTVDLLKNKFAFFRSTPPPRTFNVLEGSLPVGIYKIKMYLNYPGTGTDSWNQTYFGLGNKSNDPQRGSQFPNTAYVHIYKRVVDQYKASHDSVTVIQYCYFYRV